MKRVQCYVDGFNLYHAIDALNENHLKWVDIRSLATAFVKPSKEVLNEVFYFSAYATWLPASMMKHREYIKALETRGITTVLGHFNTNSVRCNACGSTWNSREEKATDVNFAIKLIEQAHNNCFDHAFIVTADSDLCPPIEMILNNFPTKEFTILTPPNRYRIARELRGLVNTIKIKKRHLAANLLPAHAFDEEGNILFQRPTDYDPPFVPIVHP
ncbi:MAG: NYN domain-containing protein [Legionella sp.]|uniref:NYN domain-containing protein n=1 Tax=Legionella sp. TaxID=459 RepID=UPI00283EDE7C|nr:NYN domain-containing protein [Legionella sp.]